MEETKIISAIPARIPARIIAFLVDYVIVFLMVAFLNKTIFKINLTDNITNQIKDSINKILFFAFYYVVFANFIYHGQSIGKKIMNIKIVKDNDEKIDLITLLSREVLCRVFIEQLNLWILLILSYNGVLQNILVAINLGNISLLIWYLISMPWLMILSFVMMINSNKHLSLHDRISKTKVISLKPLNIIWQ